MHFKHPELLYALFLLVIPVLVHLFQLRRFQPAYFTNVRFLKELTSQTRKSSTLKKWLLLCTRLLLLTALILAFAQPYFEAKESKLASNELVIVLDNSFSMQAQGQHGELLKRAVEDVITQVPADKKITVLTADNSYWDTDITTLKSELLHLNYTAQPFLIQDILQKIAQTHPQVGKDVVVITDGIGLQNANVSAFSSVLQPYFILPKSTTTSNVAVDSVYVHQTLDNFYELNIRLSCYGELAQQIPLAVYHQKQGIAKTRISFSKPQQDIKITIPKADFHGKVVIEDQGLLYDNDYFFSISSPKKTKVISIGDSESSAFLSRIYTADEFIYQSVPLLSVNYNDIENQDVIVLNELPQLPISLQKTIHAFVEKGGTVIGIPSDKMDVKSWNAYLRLFGKCQFSAPVATKKLVTKINFEHPVYQSVFDKKVSNFEYPFVQTSFGIQGVSNTALSLEDNSPFLLSLEKGLGKMYLFTASIAKTNSNFKLSPLVVPTFYNMAMGQTHSALAHTVGKNESLYVAVNLQKNQTVALTDGVHQYIPIQQISSNKVKVSFFDYPQHAGNFQLKKASEVLQNISFNYARTESDITQNVSDIKNQVETLDSLEEVLDTFLANRTDNEIWRWFVWLTLVFLIAEIWIQKFLK